MGTYKGDIKHGKAQSEDSEVFSAPQQSLSYYVVLSQCPLESADWFTLTLVSDGCSCVVILIIKNSQNAEPSKIQPLYPHPCRF